jgi:hypothetical protein
MGLRKTMPARDRQAANAENPHSRDYSASRGGYVDTPPKPVPGTPQDYEVTIERVDKPRRRLGR